MGSLASRRRVTTRVGVDYDVAPEKEGGCSAWVRTRRFVLLETPGREIAEVAEIDGFSSDGW